MMSRWFAFKRTSSSNGKSHSMRTSTVCISRNTLVTFSKPIIQPMYCSSIASRNGRLSRRLSILGPGCMAILSLNLNATVPTKIQWFLNLCIQRLLGQLSESSMSKHLTCVSRTYSQLQPVIQVNVQTSLYLTYLQTSCRSVYGPSTSLVFPGLTPNLSLSRYSQAFQKHVISGNQLTSHFQMTLQPTCHKNEMRQKHVT